MDGGRPAQILPVWCTFQVAREMSWQHPALKCLRWQSFGGEAMTLSLVRSACLCSETSPSKTVLYSDLLINLRIKIVLFKIFIYLFF